MANDDDTTLEKLETQVDNLLKQLDDVLKTHAAPGAPHGEHEHLTGAGKDNLAGHQRPQKKHTQQPTTGMDKAAKAYEEGDVDDMSKAFDNLSDEDASMIEKLLKARKKAAAADDSADDGDGADDDEDDWSESSDSSTSKRAPDDGESVVIAGQRIAKSAVGASLFEVIKSQNDRIEKSEVELRKARDEAEMANLRKRADDNYPLVPGTTEQRALMLKAVNGMSEDMRKAFETVFVQSQKLAKSAFETRGVMPAEMTKSANDFEKKVSEIKKRDNCTGAEALTKARIEDPEGFRAFQGH